MAENEKNEISGHKEAGHDTTSERSEAPADSAAEEKEVSYGPFEGPGGDEGKLHEEPEFSELPGSEETDYSSAEEQLAAMYPRDVTATLSAMYTLLASQAWIFMGLVINPIEGKITKDLAQAKLAIDTMDFLFPRISPHLNDNEKNEMKNLLVNLQLNFVQQSSTPENN